MRLLRDDKTGNVIDPLGLYVGSKKARDWLVFDSPPESSVLRVLYACREDSSAGRRKESGISQLLNGPGGSPIIFESLNLTTAFRCNHLYLQNKPAGRFAVL